MKKLLITLGSITTILSPIAFVVSCWDTIKAQRKEMEEIFPNDTITSSSTRDELWDASIEEYVQDENSLGLGIDWSSLKFKYEVKVLEVDYDDAKFQYKFSSIGSPKKHSKTITIYSSDRDILLKFKDSFQLEEEYVLQDNWNDLRESFPKFRSKEWIVNKDNYTSVMNSINTLFNTTDTINILKDGKTFPDGVEVYIEANSTIDETPKKTGKSSDQTLNKINFNIHLLDSTITNPEVVLTKTMNEEQKSKDILIGLVKDELEKHLDKTEYPTSDKNNLLNNSYSLPDLNDSNYQDVLDKYKHFNKFRVTYWEPARYYDSISFNVVLYDDTSTNNKKLLLRDIIYPFAIEENTNKYIIDSMYSSMLPKDVKEASDELSKFNLESTKTEEQLKVALKDTTNLGFTWNYSIGNREYILGTIETPRIYSDINDTNITNQPSRSIPYSIDLNLLKDQLGIDLAGGLSNQFNYALYFRYDWGKSGYNPNHTLRANNLIKEFEVKIVILKQVSYKDVYGEDASNYVELAWKWAKVITAK